MNQDELLRQLWLHCEAWRQYKVDTADSLSWLSPIEARIVDTLDALKANAIKQAQT